MSEAEFAQLVHASMDVEEPSGWMRLDAVLSVPDGGTVRCLDVSAHDEAGVVLDLPVADQQEFGRRFIEAFYRRGWRGIHKA